MVLPDRFMVIHGLTPVPVHGVSTNEWFHSGVSGMGIATGRGHAERLILARPDFRFGMEPVGTLTVVHLMHRFGFLRQKAVSWKDYFADPLHAEGGG